MGVALLVVWAVALAAIAALGGLVFWTLWREAAIRKAGGVADAAGRELLLFYYEQESVRSTSRGDVIVRVPGMAWESEWQEDMLRLEVERRDPAAIAVPAAWGAARVLAAVSLRAYRMTELGHDIAVERFAAPVDVFLTTGAEGGELRFGVNNEGGWTLAPLAALSLAALEGVGPAPGRGWAAASIAGMREVCLVRMPGPDRAAEVQDESIAEGK